MKFLVHRLSIERPVSSGEDEYGHAILSYEALDQVDGLIQPKSAREVANLLQAGAVVGEYTVFLFRRDLTEADRLRDVTTEPDGPVYQITGIRDFAFGKLAHLQVDAHRIGAPVVESGS
jgi:hypothetical protein